MFEEIWNFMEFINMTPYGFLLSLIFIPIFILLYYSIKKERTWRDSVSQLLNYSKLERLEIYDKLTLKEFKKQKSDMENKLAEKIFLATLPLSVLLFILLVSASKDLRTFYIKFLYYFISQHF